MYPSCMLPFSSSAYITRTRGWFKSTWIISAVATSPSVGVAVDPMAKSTVVITGWLSLTSCWSDCHILAGVSCKSPEQRVPISRTFIPIVICFYPVFLIPVKILYIFIVLMSRYVIHIYSDFFIFFKNILSDI